MASSRQKSVLITGGCGFVGYHVTRHFLQDPTFTSVICVSRNATCSPNRLPAAHYHDADLADLAQIRMLISKVQPTIIVHAATPSPVSGTLKLYERITVHGTNELLRLAKEDGSVRAFIFTSSSTMALGLEHKNLDETAPLANEDRRTHPYAMTKSRADIAVRAANAPPPSIGEASWAGHLLTGCIRLPIVYGTHDLLGIPGSLDALQKGQTNFQLGGGTNAWSFCNADNAARAHVLLANSMLSNTPQSLDVAGEAFNINDGDIHSFWEYPRLVWKFAGHEADPKSVTVMPVWLAWGIAWILETLYWIFTFGTKRPGLMGRQQVEYSCFEHTYSIRKATDMLGFHPEGDFAEGLQKAVKWQMTEGGWGDKIDKVKKQ